MRAVVAAAALLVPVVAQAALTMKITFPPTAPTLPTDEQAPVLVRLGEAINCFSYAAIPDPEVNIRFRTAGGETLPYEIESWDTTGTSLVWVRIKGVAPGMTFYMEYGTDIASSYTPASTWAGYTGVWHMNDYDMTTRTTPDATANGLGMRGKRSNATITLVPGKLGQGIQHMGNGVGGLYTPSFLGYTNGTTAFTVSGWFWHRTNGMDLHERYLSMKADNGAYPGFDFGRNNATGDSNFRFSGDDGQETGVSVLPQRSAGWNHFAIAYDGATAHIYNNGVLKKSVTTVVTPNEAGFGVGAQAGTVYNDTYTMGGSSDEARLFCGKAFSEGRIVLEYTTVAEEDYFNYDIISVPGAQFVRLADQADWASLWTVGQTVVPPAGDLGNGLYTTGTVVTFTIHENAGYEGSFGEWRGDVPAGADPTAKSISVTVGDSAVSLLTQPSTAHCWIYYEAGEPGNPAAVSCITDGNWVFGATASSLNNAVTVTSYQSVLQDDGTVGIDWSLPVIGNATGAIYWITGLTCKLQGRKPSHILFHPRFATISASDTFREIATITNMNLGVTAVKSLPYQCFHTAMQNGRDIGTSMLFPRGITSLGTSLFADLRANQSSSIKVVGTIEWPALEDFPAYVFDAGNLAGVTNMILSSPNFKGFREYTVQRMGLESLTIGSRPEKLLVCQANTLRSAVASMRSIRFLRGAPAIWILDNLLYPFAGNDGAHQVSLYGSATNGFLHIADSFTAAEAAAPKPDGAYGVYVTAAGERKAWMVADADSGDYATSYLVVCTNVDKHASSVLKLAPGNSVTLEPAAQWVYDGRLHDFVRADVEALDPAAGGFVYESSFTEVPHIYTNTGVTHRVVYIYEIYESDHIAARVNAVTGNYYSDVAFMPEGSDHGYLPGTVVAITALARTSAPHSAFVRWDGDIGTNNPCARTIVVVIDDAHKATPVWRPLSWLYYAADDPANPRNLAHVAESAYPDALETGAVTPYPCIYDGGRWKLRADKNDAACTIAICGESWKSDRSAGYGPLDLAMPVYLPGSEAPYKVAQTFLSAQGCEGRQECLPHTLSPTLSRHTLSLHT